ncbi:uncharacterized protein [Ptychodera flava]|uniref:uncharacterized protein n=1 Tax=Ptychodera flava TaxID=63121 RepID=UPI003969DDDF
MSLRTYKHTLLGCVFLVLAAIILYTGNVSFVTTANTDLFFPKWRQQQQQQQQKEVITIRTELIKSYDHEIPSTETSVEKIHPRGATALEPTGYRTVEKKSTTHAVSDVNVKQYLLPIRTKPSGGCNSQFQRFKNAIMMSLLTNRTMVTTPFFLHGGHVHGYTAEHVRPFNYTFDVNSLAKLLPLATVESYKLVCNRSNTKVIGWGVAAEDYENCKARLFRDIMGIDLPAADDLIDMQYGFEETLSKIKDVKCVAFTTSTKFLPKFDDPSAKHDMKVEISKYFVRSERVANIAEDLTKYICNGEQYVSFHWRNKSAETPCFFRNEQYPNQCADLKPEIRRWAEVGAEALSNLMKKENIKCIYVACPLWSLEIVDVLSKWIQRDRIYISEDVVKMSKHKTLLEDFYSLSLVEQEIAFRAAIFVAAGFSNWSDFVAEGREAIGRLTFDIRELANIPETVAKELIK